MVFSSSTFLFLFLPLVLAAHWAIRSVNGRNNLLLVASLIFYAWGEQHYILILLLSIAVNAFAGRRVDAGTGRARRRALILGVGANLALLGIFKYADFVMENLGRATGGGFEVPGIHLPLGISFFTFQAISYLVDVYRGDAPVQHRFRNVALYICLFPQLIAGPIVRYGGIHRFLTERSVTLDDTAAGIRRFITGLAKKVLIANVLGETADDIFGNDPAQLPATVAWLGLACYTLQIYFDFSGYSDMAIGLGRMFGFRFPENFDYPYVSRSVQEFWRRWHMTLSNWFRDYLYIPLGGNRLGTGRTAVNLLAVFLLCGLWHGASWNFVLWGLWHGAFLSLERFIRPAGRGRLPGWLGHVYLLLVVMLGWVLFRADDLPHAWAYFTALFGLNHPAGTLIGLEFFTGDKLTLALAAGVVLAAPLWPWQRAAQRWFIEPAHNTGGWPALALNTWLVAVLCLCAVMIAAGTYNPFIYFRF